MHISSLGNVSFKLFLLVWLSQEIDTLSTVDKQRKI